MRTWLIAIFLIVGLVTVAVPVCTTGVCDMAANAVEHGMTGAMGDMSHSMGDMSQAMIPVVQAVCNMGTVVTGTIEKALPPTTATTLLIGLIAALALALVSLVPRLTMFRLPAVVGDPPAPPGDPFGVCLLI